MRKKILQKLILAFSIPILFIPYFANANTFNILFRPELNIKNNFQQDKIDNYHLNLDPLAERELYYEVYEQEDGSYHENFIAITFTGRDSEPKIIRAELYLTDTNNKWTSPKIARSTSAANSTLYFPIRFNEDFHITEVESIMNKPYILLNMYANITYKYTDTGFTYTKKSPVLFLVKYLDSHFTVNNDNDNDNDNNSNYTDNNTEDEDNNAENQEDDNNYNDDNSNSYNDNNNNNNINNSNNNSNSCENNYSNTNSNNESVATEEEEEEEEVTINDFYLIKGSSPAVYLVNTKNERFYIPDWSILLSWFYNPRIIQLADAQLSQYVLAGNLIYRPGSLIKLATDPKCYAVDKNGVLRWVYNENVARAIYGPTWNQNIYIVPDALFPSYTIGDTIYSADDFQMPTLDEAIQMYK